MAQATIRIKFKGQSGSVRPNASGLYQTHQWLFVPDWVAGMPNQRAGIALSNAELEEARKPAPSPRIITTSRSSD